MTATLDHVHIPEAIQADVSTRLTRREVIRSIRDEAIAAGVECTSTQANNFLQMLEKAARRARRDGVYHIEDPELYAYHDIMVVVMPAGVAVAGTGTAHEGTNALLTEGRELGLMHTADVEHGVRYCAVAIVIETT